MRVIAVAVTLFGVFSVFVHEARADGNWCARYPEGASNCGFIPSHNAWRFAKQNAFSEPRRTRR